MTNEVENTKLTSKARDQNAKAPRKMETRSRQKEQHIRTAKCAHRNPGRAKPRDCLWAS